MDFYPALMAAVASFFWILFPLMRRQAKILYGPVLLSTLLLTVTLAVYNYRQDRELLPTRYQAKPALSHDQVANRLSRSLVWQRLPAAIYDPPSHYACSPRPQNLAPPRAISGWGYNGHCAVETFSSLFMRSSPCLTLRFGPTPASTAPPYDAATGYPLRMWSNLTPLTFARGAITDDLSSATFCHPSPPPPQEIRLISIGWTDPQHLPATDQFPFILYHVEQGS
jgi:hypothetical protein